MVKNNFFPYLYAFIMFFICKNRVEKNNILFDTINLLLTVVI